jgi:carotene epsilon-monooxygenase
MDKSGAGRSWVSPNWLTSIVRLGKGPDTSGIPVADAKLEDVKDLLGGALFLPLFKWMTESGPVYRLAAGPRNFVIVGDPAVAKHVLKGYGTKYSKGLVAEVSEFLFGDGFAIAEDQLWTVLPAPFSCPNSQHSTHFELITSSANNLRSLQWILA